MRLPITASGSPLHGSLAEVRNNPLQNNFAKLVRKQTIVAALGTYLIDEEADMFLCNVGIRVFFLF